MNTTSIPKNPSSPNPVETFTIIWSDIAILITWKPYCHGNLTAHLQIESENRLALPITNTGYRSHFVDRLEVVEHG